MSFNYENQGTNTYLVYELGVDEALDTMSLGMLTNNNIPGFVNTTFMQIDTERYIKYNVSSMVSAKQVFGGPVNKKRLLGVFSSVVEALLATEDYMLDLSEVLLDTEYIFTDVTTCEAKLICLPVIKEGASAVDVEKFFKGIIFSAQFDQTEDTSHVAELINYLNGNPGVSLIKFKELLDKLCKDSAPKEEKKAETKPVIKTEPKVAPEKKVQKETVENPEVVKKASDPAGGALVKEVISAEKQTDNTAEMKGEKDAKKSWFGLGKKKSAEDKTKQDPANLSKKAFAGIEIPGQPASAPQPVVQKPVTQQPVVQKPVQQPTPAPQPKPQPIPVPAPAPQPTPINFGETTVLGGGTVGETTVLGVPTQAARVAMPFLIRARNNEKIPLNKPIFRVGKEKSYVDYFIGDNTAISRSHANFYTNEGEYLVEDTNSTNHTFVNGKLIQSGTKVKIVSGDTIRLANEDFTFIVE